MDAVLERRSRMGPTLSDKPADYILIASIWHSGSTLLTALLGAHRQMAAVGEMDRLSLQFARSDRADKPGRCGCGRRPLDCPVWSAVAKAVKETYHVDLVTHPYDWRVSDIGCEKDLRWRAPISMAVREGFKLLRYADYYHLPVLNRLARIFPARRLWVAHRLFAAQVIKSVTATRAVIDSSKERIDLSDIHHYGTGTIRIIFLTRQVYGAVWSRVKRMKARRDVERVTKQWVKTNRQILHLLHEIPLQDWIHITYEDLCAKPVDVLQRLCAVLGYPYDPAMERFGEMDQHIIAGNNRTRTFKIDAIQEDVTWKECLTPAEVECITRIARPMANRLGYSL
jgi:Sulfotransferase family